ncbi:MAG TPA: biotin/lipoyl-binding protein [Planctomycetia bacterium]|nr:biotin/lipoyl-binding protein [Planctomycetia bacterium]
MSNRRTFFAILALTTGCGRTPPQLAPPEPPLVTVAHPATERWEMFSESTGRLAAVESVDVRARVSGYLMKVAFKEGALVKKGDPLVFIDSRPYEAAVMRLEADLKSSQAKRDEADLAFARAKGLATRGSGIVLSR